MERKDNGKYLQVRGNEKWASFSSNSKLSLTAWSEKKKESLNRQQKGYSFPPFYRIWSDLNIRLFTQLAHFGLFRPSLIDGDESFMSASKATIVKSHHPQLPFLFSSELSLCSDETPRLAFVLAIRTLLA